ncbi:unnamed protein product [Euphydryas editha]|uniref:Reverse transcriptase n=1 Tax=Euphydryas editha TaxID=104508 RepID=A0AAU9TVE7_EUPED|nr:unnamed protein product [Euphydryas editha]
MELNVQKCFHVKFSRKHVVAESNYYLNGTLIKEVNSIKDLGVIFDKKLTFDDHIQYITEKASKMLGFIMRNGKEFRNLQTKRLLYNAFVLSTLEYCAVAWRPHYACQSLRLERIQKRYLWHLAYSVGKRSKDSYESKLNYFKYISGKTWNYKRPYLFV